MLFKKARGAILEPIDISAHSVQAVSSWQNALENAYILFFLYNFRLGFRNKNIIIITIIAL